MTTALPIHPSAASPVTSAVKLHNGTPVLTICDQIFDQDAYITYFPEKAAYEDFANAGFRLFSVPVFFSSKTINEIGQVPPFSKGIFDEDIPDYSIADRLFADILKACPDAYIFPRVNLSLPLSWEQANPDELCDTGFCEHKRPCFSSDKWAADTLEFLGQLIDHIEASPYRDHICGYQLAGGNTEEWFSFDQKGSIGKRSREKFAEYLEKTGAAPTDAEYALFLSRMTAGRICQFADYTKEKTGHRLVVGAFYGYTFETPQWQSNHHALQLVLQSDSVDFLCSPVSYMDNRGPGFAHPYMLPLDSLKLHGKLYFAENDSRTHLTRPPYAIPHFDRPVWMPREKWLTVENLKLHFARALIHAHAFWWFDMWAGWYRYPLYMEMMEQFHNIAADSLKKDCQSISEVAVIVDEKANCYASEKDSRAVLYQVRKTLGLMGTPFDCYLSEDFPAVRDRYKAFLILAPYMTKDLENILEELHVKSPAASAALVITPENADISTEELRTFLRSRQVHLYSHKDAVIYANASYLFLHTASDGPAELHLPTGIRLHQIYGDPVELSKTGLPKYEGYLFEILKDSI